VAGSVQQKQLKKAAPGLCALTHDRTVLPIAADSTGQAEGKHFHLMTKCRMEKPHGFDPDVARKGKVQVGIII